MTPTKDELLKDDLLRRGRAPCAIANFAGEGDTELCGLKQAMGTATPYRLCVGAQGSKAALALPLLYAKDGRIWARAVTGRLDLREATRYPILLCTADRDTPRVLGRAGWRTRAVI
jgi:hypothetical protein